MIRFIRNCFLFSITVIVSLLIFLGAIDHTRKKTIHVEPDVHIAFFGNSQIESSVNDTLVAHSINWARSNEMPEFIYAKVKLLHKYNPQIDSIFIGFDNVLGFHYDYDEFPYQISHPYIYDMFSFEDWLTIFRNSNYDHWSNFFLYPISWRKLKEIKDFHRPGQTLQNNRILGGYVFLTRDKLAEHLQRQKQKPYSRLYCSDKTLYFFNRTIEYCKNHGIKIFFICAPQHPKVLHDLTSYKEEYKDHFSNIPFFDYVDWEMPDSCFADLNHLNYRGARVFSSFLNSQINP